MAGFELFLEIIELIVLSIYQSLVTFVNQVAQLVFPSYKDISNDIALITGAGSGVGRLLCIQLAHHCPKIVGWDIHEEALEETAKLVKLHTGVEMKCYKCDVSSKTEVFASAARVRSEVGDVSILINNAGIVNGKYLLDLSTTEFEHTMRVNTFAAFYTVSAFLPHMLGEEYEKALQRIPVGCRTTADLGRKGNQLGDCQGPARGHIVFVTSVAGTVSSPGLSDYCASKAATVMMGECLRMELSRLGLDEKINMTDVRPFLIGTKMFEGCASRVASLFPILEPDYMAQRICNAIRLNEAVVYSWRHMALLPMIFHVVPRSVLNLGMEFAGCTTMMDNFRKPPLSTGEDS